MGFSANLWWIADVPSQKSCQETCCPMFFLNELVSKDGKAAGNQRLFPRMNMSKAY